MHFSIPVIIKSIKFKKILFIITAQNIRDPGTNVIEDMQELHGTKYLYLFKDFNEGKKYLEVYYIQGWEHSIS